MIVRLIFEISDDFGSNSRRTTSISTIDESEVSKVDNKNELFKNILHSLEKDIEETHTKPVKEFLFTRNLI